MIKRGLKIGLSLVFSILEVRVKASSSDCVPQDDSCVVLVQERAYSTGSHEQKIIFYRGALAEKKKNDWKLLKGIAKVRERSVRTVFGVLESVSGEAWILDAGERRIVVRSIENPQNFKLADGRVIEIPEGHELWIGERGEDGHSTFGLPLPIEISDHLKTLARTERLSKEQLRETSAHLKEIWKDRQQVGSEIYRLSASRYIASVEEEHHQQEKKIEAQRKERDKYRQLLHQIVFEK